MNTKSLFVAAALFQTLVLSAYAQTSDPYRRRLPAPYPTSSDTFIVAEPSVRPTSFPATSPTPTILPATVVPVRTPVPVATTVPSPAPPPPTPTPVTPPQAGICAYLGGFYAPEEPYLGRPDLITDPLSLCLSWHLNVFPLSVNGRNYTMSPLTAPPLDAPPRDTAFRAMMLLNPWPSQCTASCGYYRTRAEAEANGATNIVLGCGPQAEPDDKAKCVIASVNPDFRRSPPTPVGNPAAPGDKPPAPAANPPAPDGNPMKQPIRFVTCLVREPMANECANKLIGPDSKFPLLRSPLLPAYSEDWERDPDVFFMMQNQKVFSIIENGQTVDVSCAQVAITQSRLNSAIADRPFYANIVQTTDSQSGQTPVLACKDRASADFFRTQASSPTRPDLLPPAYDRYTRSAADAACMTVGNVFGAGMGGGSTCRVLSSDVAQ